MCFRAARPVLCFTAGISLEPQSHLDPRICMQKPGNLFYIRSPEFLAACLRAVIYIYITGPPPQLVMRIFTVLKLLSQTIQVLHLMNKMNLPCPFGPITARPPMVSFSTRLLNAKFGSSSFQVIENKNLKMYDLVKQKVLCFIQCI